VHETLTTERGTGYSTTLKMMQVMKEKGLVRRNDSVRPQLYWAAESKRQTQLRLLDDLTQKAFGGSAMKLLQRMVSARRVSAEELAEIQRLIEQARGAAP
jgi:predicted transcriptional regulator